ncbi:Asp-tRNA(Asn)/Glu-tRNA(Gln) amidotransferase subunit GatC [Patescibacteria group bacterium]|nr:Asp-tRNA(Asn)/Glu-tRNA(Gln) amidotransferase subunit GatC [Patescibacteria group bacterium]
MISKKEVEHIAELVRIELSDKEVEKFQKDLSLIVDYFEIMKKVDTKNVEPMIHSVIVENVGRQDEANKLEHEATQKLLAAAPREKDGFIKVQSIL